MELHHSSSEITLTAHGFDLLQAIHRDFEDAPELRVTLADAQMRWHVEVVPLQAAMQALVTLGYLQRSSSGVYSRRPEGPRDEHDTTLSVRRGSKMPPA